VLVENFTKNEIPLAAGTLPYMAPELIIQLKNKNRDNTKLLDLKLCDVYSFGILVNEVISGKKPFSEKSGLTVEDLFEKIVTKKERPEIPKEYPERSPMAVLMKSCWDDVPSKRVPFSTLLEPKNGLMAKIKKNIPQIHNYSEKFGEKLKKKFKERNEIDFSIFWQKFEKVYGTDQSSNALSFFKLLLNITEHQQKVSKEATERICDWLSGADPKWLSEGIKGSFFFQYYFGEKKLEEIKNDPNLDPDPSKSLAVLHWDPVNGSFCVSVRYIKEKQTTWASHQLKTKTICYNDLKKEAEKETNIQRYKDKGILIWVASTLFDRIRKNVSLSQNYTQTGKDGEASIYVYY